MFLILASIDILDELWEPSELTELIERLCTLECDGEGWGLGMLTV